MNSEILFAIEVSSEGGYVAYALSASICTQGDTLDEITANIQDAVACHVGMPVQSTHLDVLAH